MQPTSFGFACSRTIPSATSASARRRYRRSAPASLEDVPHAAASSRCPRPFLCSRISVSGCLKKCRPCSPAATATFTISGSRSATKPTSTRFFARLPDYRALDRQRALRRIGGRRVQSARSLCRPRNAGGRLAARLVPLSTADRQQLRASHDRRCAAPRSGCDTRADRLVRCRSRSCRDGPRTRDRRAIAAISTLRSRRVRSIDDDRILRRLRALVEAIVRTNAFAPAATEALAFKINSSLVPGLPAPVPWREIWIYSPRVEGIHLRGGPVARGGIRWSDRRDDFRTEILGIDEGPARQECRDRSDRRQRRLLSQAIAADVQPRRMARGRHRELQDLHSLLALGH